MARRVFGLLGIVMALFPSQLRELYEGVAFANPSEVTAKPSFTSAIRAEGLVFVFISLVGGRAYRTLMCLLALAGAVALFVPKQTLRFNMNYSYERPETIEWNDGLVTVIRCFGMLYLVIAFNELTKRNQPS